MLGQQCCRWCLRDSRRAMASREVVSGGVWQHDNGLESHGLPRSGCQERGAASCQHQPSLVQPLPVAPAWHHCPPALPLPPHPPVVHHLPDVDLCEADEQQREGHQRVRDQDDEDELAGATGDVVLQQQWWQVVLARDIRAAATCWMLSDCTCLAVSAELPC